MNKLSLCVLLALCGICWSAPQFSNGDFEFNEFEMVGDNEDAIVFDDKSKRPGTRPLNGGNRGNNNGNNPGWPQQPQQPGNNNNNNRPQPGNNGNGNNGQQPGTQGNNQQNQQPPATPGVLSAEVQRCVDRCQTTPEYNPVCGSDNILYQNPGKLICSNGCQARTDIVINYYGPCSTSNSRG